LSDYLQVSKHPINQAEGMTKHVNLSILAIILVSFFMCQSDYPNSAVLVRQQFVQDSIAKVEEQARLIEEENRKLEEAWVNNAMGKMDKNARLGQLFMMPAYPPHGAGDEKKIFYAIDSHKIGGVIFFRGKEDRQHVISSPIDDGSHSE